MIVSVCQHQRTRPWSGVRRCLVTDEKINNWPVRARVRGGSRDQADTGGCGPTPGQPLSHRRDVEGITAERDTLILANQRTEQ